MNRCQNRSLFRHYWTNKVVILQRRGSRVTCSCRHVSDRAYGSGAARAGRGPAMASTLRELIARHHPLVVPSIYDGISALMLREFGFEAAYIGSYATGATRYGLPDIGYIGLEDMADQVRRLAPLAEVPIIVDGEGGWGNPLHVA